jgi:hypothetical protein
MINQIDQVHTDAESYRAHWATLAHRNPSDVYIPEALRESVPEGPSTDTADEAGHTPEGIPA